MLEALLGNINKERVLVFLVARNEGYPRQIAAFFDAPLTPIQKQAEKLETAGVLYSRYVGRSRVYALNPRCVYLKELKAMINRVLEFYPEELRDALLNNRRRPRKPEKPLTRVATDG
ncbi:winged helix-turn-helix domain-containing protein [Neptuniibacter halophilus]|uniref:winged helix-turn-helix domain-containing protein n=1 Tax=Neptuniibacter halophilus TaxID=651666 RepID=UPI0025748393|nr:winged helix-turn-helix domain-containing protein [Neptuniibacter halophilus]